MPKRSQPSPRGRQAAASAKPRPAPRRIEFVDIPEASDQQMHAKRRNVGYQTLITRVLADYVGKDLA